MKSKIGTIVLVGSVLLNVFILGALATRWFRHSFDHGDTAHGAMCGLPLFRATVQAAGGPFDDRVRKVFREHVRDARTLRSEVFAARKRAEKALLSESFDAARATSALSSLAEVERRAGESADRATLRLLEKMTPAERKRVREFIRRTAPPGAPGGPPPHGPGGHPPHGPPPGFGGPHDAPPADSMP
jgi:uncharacterized membrane protein